MWTLGGPVEREIEITEFSLRRSRAKRLLVVDLAERGPATAQVLATRLGLELRDVHGALVGNEAFRPELSLASRGLVRAAPGLTNGLGTRWELSRAGEHWRTRIAANGEFIERHEVERAGHR